MTVIIGIDPGSRRTGYGVIQLQGNRHHYLTSGYLDLTSFPACERLRQIFLGLQKIIGLYQPNEAAIEEVFMHENPNSAIKLGQARGAAIVALDIPITEYSAREIKKNLVGYGAAGKEQICYMVKRILNLNQSLAPDESDGLAIALCHAQARNLKKLLESTQHD